MNAKKSQKLPLSQLKARNLKTYELLPVVPASAGYFRIFLEENDADFKPILDPIIAWRINEFSNAIPITVDDLNEDDGTFAIVHPSGKVTYPCFGEFETTVDLANFVNRSRQTHRKKQRSDRKSELVMSFG